MVSLDLTAEMTALGQKARRAARQLATASSESKNAALRAAAEAIRADADAIAAANALDMADATAKGLTTALLDRLKLTPARIAAMADGLLEIAAMPDPVGTIIAGWDRPNGLHIDRVRTPLGVIGVIYESRPNVTADAGALCLKAGNAVILRGGSESFRSSSAILACLHKGLLAAGLPVEAIQGVPTSDRAAVGLLLTMDKYIDVIVPRGGRGLVERVMAESRIPTFQHLDGLCHTYVHAEADLEQARRVVLNAKMRRTGVCGATETVLVDEAIAAAFLPGMVSDLQAAGCEVRGDSVAKSIVPSLTPATDADWDTEYLDAILSVKVVADLEAAITHIDRHSSHHTEAILTENADAATRFMNEIDSAILLWNASTQFADGGEFGMGAEIGISTGKLHARGPVGVEQLTTFKYKIVGHGTVRA